MSLTIEERRKAAIESATEFLIIACALVTDDKGTLLNVRPSGEETVDYLEKFLDLQKAKLLNGAYKNAIHNFGTEKD